MIIPIIVQQAATIAGVSANLLFSVCMVETGLENKNSFNDGHGRGSLGYCQVSVEVARHFKPEADRIALQQPGYNLLVAGLYLQELMGKYKNNIYSSVSAYNAGLAWWDEEKHEYKNQNYVNKVMNIYSKLEN